SENGDRRRRQTLAVGFADRELRRIHLLRRSGARKKESGDTPARKQGYGEAAIERKKARRGSARSSQRVAGRGRRLARRSAQERRRAGRRGGRLGCGDGRRAAARARCRGKNLGF